MCSRANPFRNQSRDSTRSTKGRDVLRTCGRAPFHIRECAAWDAREDPRLHGRAARGGCGGEVTRAGAARWTEGALRLSLATAFLSPVGDRLGAWGPHGSPHASWGDWQHFRIYADHLNWYMPAAVQPTAAVLATAGEVIFAIALITGFRLREAAVGSGVLLTIFGISMALATQLAREAGAYVIGTGRAAARQKALDFGAQEFVDLENDALEDVGGVDLVFDVLGGDIAKRSAGLIRAGGTLVTITGPSEARPADGLKVDFVVESDRAQLSEIVRRARDGRVRTNIGKVSTLDDAVAAFNRTERVTGKTIMRVRP